MRQQKRYNVHNTELSVSVCISFHSNYALHLNVCHFYIQHIFSREINKSHLNTNLFIVTYINSSICDIYKFLLKHCFLQETLCKSRSAEGLIRAISSVLPNFTLFAHQRYIQGVVIFGKSVQSNTIFTLFSVIQNFSKYY